MLNSFFKIAGHNNIPGYYDFAFIPDTDILHLPDVVNGSINMDEAVLATDKIFYSGYATLNTLNLGDEAKITNHGQTSPVELGGSTPLVNNTNLQLFSEMARMRYVLLCRDNNNRWYIAGEPGNGLVFEFKRTAAALVFTFKGNYSHVCWEVSGNVLVDGTIIDTGDIPTSPGGGGGTGGDVVIKKTGGVVIATITAPDEYTVADSTVAVKKSDGTTIATKTVKAASSDEYLVDDSTVAVKKSDGTTIATKTVKAASADEYLVDDSTVNVKRSDGTLIIAKTVKAASTVDNSVADTTVNLKDGEGNLLSTHSIKAESSAVDIPAPDAILEVKDTAGNLLYGDLALSGETKVVTAPNSGVTLNGTAWIAPRSGQTVAATLKNEIGADIAATVTGADLVVNTNAALAAYINGNN